LFAAESQRRELLAGLIDTDGSVGADGRVRFSNTNERLVRDVRVLVCSLGYRAGVVEFEPSLSSSGIQGKKKVYQVCFTPHDQEAAAMPRKRRGVLGMHRRLAIVKAERVPSEAGRCIQTAAPDGIYLVTESFIPTHNSEMCSHWFPVWGLGLDPTTKIILASYEAEFAKTWGRKTRGSVHDGYPMLGARIVEDSRAAHRWETTAGGGMVTAGVGGPITGRGCNIGIVDDPIKNAEEANSEVIRQNIWDWWTTTFLTRLEPDRQGREPIVILIMTRWHEDDLAGRIMASEEFKLWRHINLPALAEPDDALGRLEGEALWPERFNETTLAGKHAEGGSRAFAALYQQRPSPAEGSAIQKAWWKWYDDAPPLDEFDQIVQSWDPTFKDASSSDFVAGGVWGRKGSDFYLLDCEHRRLNGPDTLKAIATMDERWPRARYLLIEDSASGTMIGQILHRERGHVIMVQTKGRSKEVRLHWGVNSVAAIIERGRVWLPRGRTFSMKLVEEAANFPHGTHDDLLDMAVQAIQHLMPAAWADEGMAAEARRNAAPATPREAYNAHLRACIKRKQELYMNATDDEDPIQFPGM
jgi:predicted phage terminase large subunit-like protein